jgi:hypothetical protein
MSSNMIFRAFFKDFPAIVLTYLLLRAKRTENCKKRKTGKLFIVSETGAGCKLEFAFRKLMLDQNILTKDKNKI